MTSVPGFRPSHDPIEASLTSADDRVRLDHWLPPQASGAANSIGRRWVNVLWVVPIVFVLLVLAIAKPCASCRRCRISSRDTQVFLLGQSVDGISLRRGYLLNLFFMVFIIRSGVQVLADHPRLYWKRDARPELSGAASRSRFRLAAFGPRRMIR